MPANLFPNSKEVPRNSHHDSNLPADWLDAFRDQGSITPLMLLPADVVEILDTFRGQHRRCGVLLERETPRYTILRCAPCRMGVWQRR